LDGGWDRDGEYAPSLTHPIAIPTGDILAIPASTFASESAFSMGGRVLSPRRSSLHFDTVEALMCLQNWIVGEYSSNNKITFDICNYVNYWTYFNL